MKFAIARNDARDLNFAINCRLAGAISDTELVMWADYIVEHATIEVPSYIYDLSMAKRLNAIDIGRIIGTPLPSSPELTDDEHAVLDIIAFKRNLPDFKLPSGMPRNYISPNEIPSEVRDSMTSRFKTAFPFIAFDKIMP